MKATEALAVLAAANQAFAESTFTNEEKLGVAAELLRLLPPASLFTHTNSTLSCVSRSIKERMDALEPKVEQRATEDGDVDRHAGESEGAKAPTEDTAPRKRKAK